MTPTADLITWLLARLDEDEQVALAAAGEWGNGLPATIHPDPTVFRTVTRGTGQVCGSILAADAEHIARHDPVRVLREVDAKRQIIKLYENALHAHRDGPVIERNRIQDEAAVDVLGVAVYLLALPYADHPDYQADWTPST